MVDIATVNVTLGAPATNTAITVPGMQGTPGVFQSILGTTNEVNVAISGSGGSIATLSTPQAIATTSSPTFAGLSITNSSTGQLIVDTTGYTPTATNPAGVIFRNTNVYSNVVTYGSGAVLFDHSQCIDTDQPNVFIQNNCSTVSDGNTAWLELINTAGGFKGIGTSLTNTNFVSTSPIGGSIEMVALNASIGTVSTATITNGGSGYVTGTYTAVPLTTTTGFGISGTATIVVNGSGVVSSITITGFISSSQGGAGSNYAVGDTLSASNANLGGSGSGLVLTVASVVGYNGKAKFGVVSGITGIGAGHYYQDGYVYLGSRRSSLHASGANTGFENQLRMYALSPTGQGWINYDGSGILVAPIYNFGVPSQLSNINAYNSASIVNEAITATGTAATIENQSKGASGSSYIRTLTSTGGASLYCETDDTVSTSAVIVRSNWGGTAGTGKSQLVLFTDNTSNSASGWSLTSQGTGTGSQASTLTLGRIVSGTTTIALTYSISSGGVVAEHQGTGGTYYRTRSTSGSGGATNYIQVDDSNSATLVVRSNWVTTGTGTSAIELFTDNTSSLASGWFIGTSGSGSPSVASTLFIKCYTAGTPANYITVGNTGIVTLLSTAASTSTTTGALIVDGGVGVAGNLNVGGGIGFSLSATVSAAGTTQGTATVLTADTNVVTTVASGTGVVLPTGVGREITVINRGANALLVYPASGAQIDGAAANAATSVPVNGWLTVNVDSTTQYFAIDPVTVAGAGISVTQSNNGTLTIANTGVTSVNATANQISASASTGTVTLSIPSSFIAPGSVQATTTLNVATNTAKAFVYSDASSNVVTTAAPTNGQLLIGSTGAVPVAAAIAQGTTNGVTVTNGAGTITLDTAQDIRSSASPTFVGGTFSGAVSGITTLGTSSTVTAQTTTAATSGANHSSPSLTLGGTYWTSSASANDTWTVTVNYGTGANPKSTINFNHATGSSGGGNFAINNNFTVSTGGGIGTIGGVATTGNGVAILQGAVNITAQAANVAATTVLGATTAAALYRASFYISVSQLPTTSYTLPDTELIYTDRNNGQVITVPMTSSKTGTVGYTFASADFVFDATAATNIQYAIGQNTAYASVGATAMNYVFRARFENLG